jgi:hypothetical protein
MDADRVREIRKAAASGDDQELKAAFAGLNAGQRAEAVQQAISEALAELNAAAASASALPAGIGIATRDLHVLTLLLAAVS